MSLLTAQATQPTPPTKEQRQAAAATALSRMAPSTYAALCAAQKESMRLAWNFPGLTPQDVADALGTKAATMTEFQETLTAAIVAIASKDGIQPDIALPRNAYTKNPDGTVTVSAEPYTFEEVVTE